MKGKDLDPEIEEDIRLVKQYQKFNDENVLTQILKRWTPLAMGAAMQIMCNQNNAEDIVQESFIKIIKNLHQCEASYGIRGWVKKIVYHTCINKINEESKRKIREEKVYTKIFTEKIGEREEENEELVAQVKEAWSKLPSNYRLPVWMRHYDQMAFHEIASVLSIPENTVKSQAKRGLLKLKDILSQSGITLSMSMLIGVLSQMKLEASSVNVHSSIAEIIVSSKGNSERILAFASAGGKASFKLTVFKYFLAFALIGFSIILGFKNFPIDSHEGGHSQVSNLNDKKTVFLNFDKQEQLNHIRTIQGELKWSKDLGSNNSGCLVTDKGINIIKIGLSDVQLPLKISFLKSFRIEEQLFGTLVYYKKFNWICQVFGFGQNKKDYNLQISKELIKWLKIEYYVFPDKIVSFSDGRATGLDLYDQHCDINDLTIMFFNEIFIDNLAVEPLTNDEVYKNHETINIIQNHAQILSKKAVENLPYTHTITPNGHKYELRFKPPYIFDASKISLNLSGK